MRRAILTFIFTLLLSACSVSTAIKSDISDKALVTLKRDEGYSRTAYFDPSNKNWTIGVGRNLNVHLEEDEINSLKEQPVSDQQVHEWLEEDLRVAQSECKRIFQSSWFEISENRRVVLINMWFTLGTTGLKQFVNMIDAIERKDFNAAAEEMLNSKWALDVKGRSKRLAYAMRYDRFREGDYDFEGDS